MRHQTSLSIVGIGACAALCAAAAHPTASLARTAGMSGMSAPANPAGPTREAYTGNHAFLIKLRSVPRPIPFEKYFTLQFAVYDGHHPTMPLANAHLTVTAGMRHGLKHGFAHGMQSSPRIGARAGTFVVSGLYFHMMGPWTLRVDAERNGERGTAYFTLPCCGR